MFNRDRDLLQGHWERKDRKCFCRVNCSKSWEMIWARESVELITRLVWWNVCSKLNIKDQRRAVGFCLDFALKVMESQQKGRRQCILQDSLGSSVWEALKGKMESCFIFFLNLQLPQFNQRFVSGTSNQQELPRGLWSLFMPGVDPTAPSEVIPSTDDLGWALTSCSWN